MKRIYLNLLALAFILFGLTAAVAAQSDAPSLEPSVEYAYGQEIRFSLQGHNASDVEQITLSFRPELSQTAYEVDVPFQPGNTISLTQAVDVHGLDIRPFGDVNYSWQLATANGVHSVPEQSFTYQDDRFGWQTMVRDNAIVHWTGEGPLFGQNVLDIVQSSLTGLLETMPLEKVDQIDVYVYPSSADLRTALRLGGVEEMQPDQRDLGVILVTAVNTQTAESDLQQSIPYELANLVLYRAAGERVSAIPWWLREGVAENARPADNPRYDQLLFAAIESGETFPLWRLCEQPQESGDRYALAAAQSTSVVSFISEKYIAGTAADLLSAYIDGDYCEQGVERVLGQSLDELERAWLAGLQEPSPVRQLFNDAMPWIILLFGGTLLILILLGIARMKE